MNKAKPNITLLNMSEIYQSGLFIALHKGINELFNKKKNKSCKKTTCGATTYSDIISVIICTSNRGALAENALKSILQQSYNGKFEVILVNNSENPLPFIPDSPVKVINEAIQGLSAARNTGAKHANGEFLLYIDDDAEADENLLKSIYSAFSDKRGFSIIGGQIHLRLPNPVPDVFLTGRESLWSAYTVPYKKIKEVHEQYEFPYGACFAIRHSVLDSLGGFPSSYGRCGNNYAGGEETAVCFLAVNSGFKIGIAPNASVIHCVSPDRFTKEHIRNTIRESILTTYRLFCDGYSSHGWTVSYVNERISIAEKEMNKLCGLELFYKQCEYDALCELRKIMV